MSEHFQNTTLLEQFQSLIEKQKIPNYFSVFLLDFGIVPTMWYFGIASTVWYFGIAPTV
jgi:hypothetical protein